MSSRGDKLVQKYKELAKIPALVDARILKNKTGVDTIWSQRNIEHGKLIKFSKTVLITEGLLKQSELLPHDTSSENLISISPSQEYRALVRTVDEKEGPKQYLEIWSNECLLHTTDVSDLDLHDEIYTEAELGALEWSPDETKLIYVAEKKEPKSQPFFKKKNANAETSKESETTKGEQFFYRQDWGEQYISRRESVIVQYDRINDTFSILEGFPEGVFPIQVVWSPDGTYIAGVALRTSPRKLGLIYCNNRPGSIFTLTFDKHYEEVSLEGKAARYPFFCPNTKTLLWFERTGVSHNGCFALVAKDLSIKNTNIRTVVSVVDREKQICGGRLFHGLFNPIVPKRCWASSDRLICSVQQINTINTYCINIVSGLITELPYPEGSQIVLDVQNDVIIVNRRNFFLSDRLAIGLFPEVGKEELISIHNLTDSVEMEFAENFTYNYLHLEHKSQDFVDSFSAIYVGPKLGNKHEFPLIVYPHGGPHAAFSNCLFLELSILNSLGFAVLLVNFRGSIGVGEDAVKFLLGKIGSTDVQDCILATKTVLNQYPWLDPNRIALTGGSHGGFLVTHLSGQYPDMFKVVVARNPVIDVASMSITSDIPDWCYVECGYTYSQVGIPSEEVLTKMRKVSPIEYAHNVQAPTLLQIGSKDKRVPSSQGIEYFHRLKANGKIVRMNLYDDNHPISSVHNEIDNVINSILWIQEYIYVKQD